MRFLSKVLHVVLAAGMMLVAGPAMAGMGASPAPISRPASADVRPSAEPLPGTPAEEQEYARREAASPEVQDYSGGAVIVGVSLLAAVVIVILIIVLMD